MTKHITNDEIIASLVAEPSNGNYVCARHFAVDYPTVRKADIAALVKSAFDSLQLADLVTEEEYRGSNRITTLIQIYEAKQPDGSYALASRVVKGGKFDHQIPANCYRYIAFDIGAYAIAVGQNLNLETGSWIRELVTAAYKVFKGETVTGGLVSVHYLSGEKIAAAAA